MTLQALFGELESLLCFDTYQFEDYSKVVASRFEEKHKAKIRKEVFARDCQNTYNMGVRFASLKL